MFQVGTDWNPRQARLKEIIAKPDKFDEMRALLSHMHSLLHKSCVYDTNPETYMDEIWDGLEEKAFSAAPAAGGATVAWNIWHITRIEDLTANILVDNGRQVLDEDRLKSLNTRVKDTGNSMTDEEIIKFSEELSMSELEKYRNDVGKRTREIIENLRQEDMKRRVEKERLARILDEGGVSRHKDSSGLLDFWGKKTVSGIFLMPITRHQIVHLNACQRLKERYKKRGA